MEYAVIDVATARAHGIEILPTQRQSNDKTKAVIHANMVAGIDVFNQLKRYQFDDPEFIALLNSPEWTPEEGAEVPDENFGKVMAAQIIKDEIAEEINTYHLSDKEAVQVKSMHPKWKVGISVKKEERYEHLDKLYEVDQDHVTQENWAPDKQSSLWHEVSYHEGTKEDPIPYNENHDPQFQGMVLELGKFYIQDEVVYECIRDSQGVKIVQDLAGLVDNYVKVVK